MSEQEKDKEQHGHGDKLVTIHIDNTPHKVERGQSTIADLKRIGGVDPTFDLLEQRHGKLVPLPDDGRTHIEGGEVFFGQPKTGASS